MKRAPWICGCGGYKEPRSKLCQACRERRRFTPATVTKIVQLYAEGVPVKAIARQLKRSPKTIEYHVAAFRRLHHLPSGVHLVHWGLRHAGAKWLV